MKLLHKSGREIELDTLSTLKNLAIYPGSFNPLHEGHKGIYQLLRRQGFNVVFEMSKSRFQKPAYSKFDIRYSIFVIRNSQSSALLLTSVIWLS